jgi:hypothetical protein
MPTRAEWDARFSAWSQPPGQTERDKCDNAVRAIRKAINASAALAGRMVRVFPQGSYNNRTNVRAESDVDVCVCSSYTIYYAPEMPPPQVGLVPATYMFDDFREDVRAALVAHFGAAGVSSGSKAFDVHENTNRIAADVVPTFEFRSYVYGAPLHVGTAFMANRRRIVNFPQQHYDNGVAKNTATGRRFKAITRILKRLRYEMLNDYAYAAAAVGVQSFEIESMVWNVPDPLLLGGAASPMLVSLIPDAGIREPLTQVLCHLYAGTATDQACASWKEVNGIKALFSAGQPWSCEAARTFIAAAWAYAELNKQ